MTGWLKRIHCAVLGHDLKLVGQKIEGAQLDWLANVVRGFGFDYVCRRCGKEIFKGGYIVPGDRRRNPDRYNDRGWPVDENGEELPVVPDTLPSNVFPFTTIKRKS